MLTAAIVEPTSKPTSEPPGHTSSIPVHYALMSLNIIVAALLLLDLKDVEPTVSYCRRRKLTGGKDDVADTCHLDLNDVWVDHVVVLVPLHLMHTLYMRRSARTADVGLSRSSRTVHPHSPPSLSHSFKTRLPRGRPPRSRAAGPWPSACTVHAAPS